MKELYELKEKLMDELKEQAKDIGKKGKMTAGDLDTVAKLTKSIDRLCDIVEDMDDGASHAGTWNANMNGEYGNGHSYRGRRRDSRGRYSHNGGYSNNSGYSYGGGIISELRELMGEAKDDRERRALEDAIRTLER